MNIGPLAVGGDQPCALIGEISNNANGKYGNAVRLLDGLKAAGASAAKLQCYTPDELVALRGDGPAPAQWSHMTMRELYTRAATPLGWFPGLFRHAESIELPLFSSVFGLESLKVLEDCGCPAYKIARLDNHHAWLGEAVAATGKPIIASGFREKTELAADAWLLCHPGYPSTVDWLPYFGEGENRWDGLSSHNLDPRLPIAAVARGCRLIEMHVQLDDEPSELEANVSLTVSQFRSMVDDVRVTETLLGC